MIKTKRKTSVRMRILRLSLISVAVAILTLSAILAMQLDYVSTRAFKSEMESLSISYANSIQAIVNTDMPDDEIPTAISNALSVEHLGQGGLINVIDKDNNIVASSELSNIGTSIGMAGAVAEGSHELGNNLVAHCMPIQNTDDWCVVVVGNLTASHAVVGECLTISLSFGAILCIVAIVVTLKISKQIVTPIKATTERLELLSKGDLSTEVKVFARRDETEKLSNALQQVCIELKKYISNIVETTSEMANGDFTYQHQMDYLGDFESIPQSFSRIHNMLQETIHNLIESTDGVRSGSDQIAAGAQMLAEGTTRQATAADELTSTISEISNGIDSTAKGADEASTISNDCASRMRKQDEAMTKMLEAMETIEQKSEAISNVIKAIEDIAFQTNILALNASIEAARAGEAGKGFAVVASEVGNLAQKSAQSADSTKELITSTLEAVKVGSQIANETAIALKEVTELSEKSAELVQHIAEDANMQAVALTQATKGIEDISQVIQQNSATAEESAASCEELSAQTKLLTEQVSKLKA